MRGTLLKALLKIAIFDDLSQLVNGHLAQETVSYALDL